MTTSFDLLAVTRRPAYRDHLQATCARLGGGLLYEEHHEGLFADAVNRALSRARSPVVLKVDDHDIYPSDHAQILEGWQPGVLLHGVARFVGCDGRDLGSWPSLCASAFPSELRVWADRAGGITQSVLNQCERRVVETGVEKLVCPGDWSWTRRPRFRVVCSHRGNLRSVASEGVVIGG